MKVIWDIRGNVAVPMDNIKELEIGTTDEWSESAKAECNGRYYVKASYTICTGKNMIVYTADTKEDCIRYIEKL